jgi:hypothetical protein
MTNQTNKASNEVAVAGNASLPAYLQNMQGQGAVLSGVDATDLILPRIKLLQAISAEVTAFDEAKAGLFWHNVLGEPIGPEFDFIVCSFRKKYLLMAPMGDPRKVMARAEDGIHWEPPNGEFRVKLKNVKEEQTWKTAPTVAGSGLDKFGSSVKGDPDSKPAAVLVYEYLVYLPDFPQFSPIIMSLARSQTKKGKDLNSKITFRNLPLQAMRFRARVVEETGDEGPFKNYDFISHGFATEEEFARCQKIAEQFTSYKVADEESVGNEGDVQSGGATSQEY